MSVIIFILKLIGIILLVLLGILLLTVALVLFVPVRYLVYGQIDEEQTVHVKLHWLLHFLSFRADYEGEQFVSTLRILGIRKKAKAKSALAEDAWEDEEASDDETLNVDEEYDEPDGGVTEDKTYQEACVKTNRETHQEICDIAEKQKGKSGIVSKLRARIRNVFATLYRIKEAIPRILKKVRNAKEILLDEANKILLLKVLAELKYLLGHFKFRKLMTDLQFSAGDPAVTGQALGVLCLFPVLYKYQVSICPDFESETFYVKGTFEIRGRMRVLHLVISLVRLFKQKEVRVFVKKLLDR